MHPAPSYIPFSFLPTLLVYSTVGIHPLRSLPTFRKAFRNNTYRRFLPVPEQYRSTTAPAPSCSFEYNLPAIPQGVPPHPESGHSCSSIPGSVLTGPVLPHDPPEAYPSISGNKIPLLSEEIHTGFFPEGD